MSYTYLYNSITYLRQCETNNSTQYVFFEPDWQDLALAKFNLWLMDTQINKLKMIPSIIYFKPQR